MLIKCTNPKCSLIWLYPMPTREELPNFYVKYFTHGKNTARSDDNFISNIVKSFIYMLTDKKMTDNMYLSKIVPGNLLDIGCGDGTFLHKMRQFGWQVSGTEIDKKAIASCKEKYGISCVEGELSDVGAPKNVFDAVTAIHVLEHLHDPLKTITKCHDILKDGARLVILTPNSGSLGHRLWGRFWRGLETPRHLNVFSKGSLFILLQKAGFSKIQISSTASNANIILEGSMLIKSKKANKYLSWIIMIIESFLCRLNINIGEELVAIATK